jgi:FtsZ-interacting cell division protein ZipA
VSETMLLIIVLIVVAVVAVLLVAFLVYRRRRGQREQQERQERARQEYGAEYERLAEERGSEEEAEQELRERRERVEGDVRPLSEESLRGYEERWLRVERTFVDDPGAALNEADRVVEEILVERNFPTGSRQEASEGVGVMHPGVGEEFREAQRTHRDATGSEGEADLEGMRRAIQKYRSVYERLTER